MSSCRQELLVKVEQAVKGPDCCITESYIGLMSVVSWFHCGTLADANHLKAVSSYIANSTRPTWTPTSTSSLPCEDPREEVGMSDFCLDARFSSRGCPLGMRTFTRVRVLYMINYRVHVYKITR